MDKKQAEQLIRQVLSNVKATIAEHNAIQKAVDVLCSPEPVTKEKTPEE